MTNNNNIYRVNNEAGILAGAIRPTADGRYVAFGMKNQKLGSFATVTEAIAKIHSL